MMIRYFLLTCCTVMSTQLLTVSEIVLSESIWDADNNKQFDFYNTSYPVYFVLGAIDSLIAMCFILLTFSFTKRYYDRLCRHPHRCCVWLWLRATALDAGGAQSDENDVKEARRETCRQLTYNLSHQLGVDGEDDTIVT